VASGCGAPFASPSRVILLAKYLPVRMGVFQPSAG